MTDKMRTPVKKISPIFLLLTGAMPLFFTLFFIIKQQLIRHKMKDKLENEMLHTIAVSKNEVQWVKYNKEIRVGDKLFDIKSFSEKNGLIYFIGLFDDEETALNDLMERDTDEKNKNHVTQLFHWLQTPCLNVFFDPGIIHTIKKVFSFPILLNISPPFLNILTPPPQFMKV
jgi:hypothetical protein